MKADNRLLKRLYRLIPMFLLLCTIKMQGQASFQWAKSIGSAYSSGNNGDQGRRIYVDSENNVIVYGASHLWTEFGDTTIRGYHGQFTTTAAMQYLMKYDCNGNRLWVQAIGDANGCGVTNSGDIVIDANNNIYITGTVNLNNGNLLAPIFYIGDSMIVKSRIQSQTAYMAKLNPQGKLLWFRRAELVQASDSLTTLTSRGLRIMLDDQDNPAMLVQMLHPNAHRFANQTLPLGISLVRMDANGNNISVSPALVSNTDIGMNNQKYLIKNNHLYYLSLGPSGGQNPPPLVFLGQTYPNPIPFVSNSFLAKVNLSDYSLVWMKRSSGGNFRLTDIAIDAKDNIYLSLNANNNSIFNGDTINFNIIGAAQVSTLFKLDKHGNTVFYKLVNSNGSNAAFGVCIDKTENKITVLNSNFGNAIIDGVTYPSPSFGGNASLCFYTRDSLGNFLDIQFLGSNSSTTNAFTHGDYDAYGNLYFVGFVGEPIAFPSDPLNYFPFVGGLTDLFFGKYGTAGCSPPPQPQLQVLAPNGNEVFQHQSTETIKWQSQLVDSIQIEYSINNGQTWQTIAAYLPAGIDSMSWALPTLNTTSSNCLIRISVLDQGISLQDVSDTLFTITSDVNLQEYTNLPIQVYPNPANQRVEVVLPQVATGSVLAIYDINGRKLKQQSVSGIRNHLNLNDLPNGMYLLQWQNGDAILSREKLNILR